MIFRRCKALLPAAALALTAVVTSGCAVANQSSASSAVALPGLQAVNPAGTGSALPLAPVIPPSGNLLALHSAPLQTDFEGETLGTKKGEAESYYIKEPFTAQFSASFMHTSIEEAMKDGGITKITHIDYDVLQVLGFFGRFKVIVYGE